MKSRFYIMVSLTFLTILASCKKDNYEAPEADFNGRIVYKGEAINVQYGNLNFELWQPGFGKNGAINVNVNQEGAFSAKLFDGNYKLVFSSNQGPFLWPKNAGGAQDTLSVNISGAKTMDLEVLPYYMIRNASISYASNKVSGTCTLEKIITDANARDVERVSLYINKTQFVDGSNNIAVQNLSDGVANAGGTLSLSVDIPTIVPTQNYVFARIGVKIAGVEDMIFTPVSKIEF